MRLPLARYSTKALYEKQDRYIFEQDRGMTKGAAHGSVMVSGEARRHMGFVGVVQGEAVHDSRMAPCKAKRQGEGEPERQEGRTEGAVL